MPPKQHTQPGDLTDPVVVAHSAGGLLLPAVAGEIDARHQISLAAAVPDHAARRSFLNEVRQDGPPLSSLDWIGVDPVAEPRAPHDRRPIPGACFDISSAEARGRRAGEQLCGKPFLRR